MSLMRLFGVRVPGMTAGPSTCSTSETCPASRATRATPRLRRESRLRGEGRCLARRAGTRSHRSRGLRRRPCRGRAGPPRTAGSHRTLRRRTHRPDDLVRHPAAGCSSITSRASLKSGVGLGAIAQLAEAVGQPEKALTLVAGLGNIDSAGPSLGMWDLSRAARDPGWRPCSTRAPRACTASSPHPAPAR